MKKSFLAAKVGLLAFNLGAYALMLQTPSSARAELIYGLTSGGSLFSFDSASPGTASAQTAITGVTAGQTLVGMDFRPATGQLYAMSMNASGAAQLYTLTLGTGVAVPVGGGFTIAANVQNLRIGFDFNPVADRIRVIVGFTSATTGGNSYRVNPINGTLAGTDTSVAYDAGDANAGTLPGVVGLAYTNNFNGATTTTLYGYDFSNDAIVRVGSLNGTPISPNAGTLFTVGNSGIVTNTASFDLDISGTGMAFGNFDVTSTSDGFYTINLATGAVTLVGQIGSGIDVLDIAAFAVPEPSVYALVAAGIGVFFASKIWRSRRRTQAAA